MRAAPAVSVVCSRGGAWRGLHGLLPALAAGALCAWALGHLKLPTWPALILAGLVGALLRARLERTQPVTLRWDGEQWRADDVAGTLSVMIDLGPWLLLRLQPALPRARPLWLPVSAADAGPAFHALRAAAYARPPQGPARAVPAPPDATDPATGAR